jgi:hypothetical protein
LHIEIIGIEAQISACYFQPIQDVYVEVSKLDTAVEARAECLNHARAQNRLCAAQEDGRGNEDAYYYNEKSHSDP